MKFLVNFVMLLCATSVWGWWDKTTHPILTEYSAKEFFDPTFLLQIATKLMVKPSRQCYGSEKVRLLKMKVIFWGYQLAL
jgi:hypothetical protein